MNMLLLMDCLLSLDNFLKIQYNKNMSPDLEKQLVEKYPNIFTDYKGDPIETCMAWGCEHDDGWFNLLDNLCAYIEECVRYRSKYKANDQYVPKEGELDKWGYLDIPYPKVIFTQVKEKFAGLRIYFHLVDVATEEQLAKIDFDSYQKAREFIWQSVSGAIEFTEFLSHKTCEFCGNKGRVYRDGWFKTLCPECAKKQNRDDSHITELP